ncbi:MAG: ABC transporter permease [Candidatus Odinarchaeia archaeon]
MNINRNVIYVLWLRELKRFIRSKSRIVGTLVLPLLFMVFLGLGFGNMILPGMPTPINYINFLIPGIVGMTMLFTSMFAGLSVLWDKEFGFLKEIMVAPVSRVSIVLGRTAGNITTTMIQGSLVLGLGYLMGLQFTGVLSILIALVFMALISSIFIGLGLIIASNMRDIQGFSIIMNFVTMPLFFLSGAIYPIANLPEWIAPVVFIDPLTYGVDGLRGALLGVSIVPLYIDFIILIVLAVVLITLGAYFFEKSEGV